MRIRVLFVSLSIVATTALPLVALAVSPNQAPAPTGLTAPASIAGANVTARDPLAKTCILKLFQDQTAKQKAGKANGGLTSGLKDNCTDETVTENAQGVRVYTQTAREGNKNDVSKNQCIVDSCSKPACGTVTLAFKVPGLATPSPISKCDSQAQKMVDAFSTPQGQKDFQLNAVNQKAIQDVIDGTDASKKQSLLESFGIPTDEAAKLATKQPQDANALLSALATGDSTKINNAAQSAGITLNSDTMNNITSLSPQQLSQKLSDNSLLSSDQQSTINNINNSPSTFAPTDPTTTATTMRGGQYAGTFSQLEQNGHLPAGYLAGVATVESRGNPSICTTVPGSSACGMFQYTKRTWRVDSALINNGVPLPDSYRLDPVWSAKVTAAAAERNLQVYGNTITNSGMDTSAALYSLHNLGGNGGSRLMNGFAQDPNQPVSAVLTATEIRNNPSLYGNGSISLAQAQNNMIAAMNGQATFTSSSQIASGGSPFGFGFGGTGGTSQVTSFTTDGQSPFSNVSFIPPNAYPQSAPQGVGQYGGSTGQVSQAGYQQSSSVGSNTSSLNPSNTAPTGQTGSAVAQIIAQPATVLHGSSVSISWSSAGLRSANDCSVFEGTSTVVAQGNEGTQQIPATTAGTIVFSVKCTVPSTGQMISSSASVKVQ